MAPNQSKSASGGNTPKPANNPAGGSGQSAKDKSRAQSRPVSGKAAGAKAGKAGAPGGGKGGNTPRPGSRPAAQPKKGRFSGAMLAWGAVGLVVVVIAALVIVKATSGSSSNKATYTPVTTAPASVVHDVTTIPTSVYNTVGVTSPTVQVSPPIVLSKQPPLSIDGKSPAMLYYGAEYCPYCAAERWAMTAALSRFGTWSGLKITASSHTDVDPITHTFSYAGATLTSPYLTFRGIEAFTNVPTTTYYTTLQTPTNAEKKIINAGQQFIPNAQSGAVSFPFVNIGNVAIISGASYDPGILSGQTWTQIASGLSNPNNPATQAIVAAANYMTAAICASTKNAPASVCTSPGVQAATKALKLS
jgi:Domain of unknown function (DUF929)